MPPKMDNVAKLLAAEERRNKLVADAKARKAQKVKQAKADADKDLGDFRREKEAEFEAFAAAQRSAAEAEQAAFVRETDVHMALMRKLADQRLDKVATIMADLILSTKA